MFSKVEIPKVTKHKSVTDSVSVQNKGKKQTVNYNDNRSSVTVQRKMQDIANNRTKVIQKRTYYAYGRADSVPHIHVYSGGDCHLKIQHRGSIKRYNIVKNGRRHSQADMALEAAAGNQTLINAINDLL